MIQAYFLDNQEYGADDINTVLSALFLPGVTTPFADASIPSDFNTLTGNVMERGIADINGNGFLVYQASGNYYASKGAAIFENGCMVISSAAEMLSVTSGVQNYVYLEYSQALNICRLVCGTQTGEGSIIPLAEIGADGAISDKRIVAVSKTATLSGNITRTLNLELEFWSGGDKEYSIDVGFAGFNYIMAAYTAGTQNYRDYAALGSTPERRMYVGAYHSVEVSKNGAVLHIKTHNSGTGYSKQTITFILA